MSFKFPCVFSATALILALFLAGCDDKSKTDSKGGDATKANTGGGSPKKAGTIGLSVLTMANPFFREIADSLADEAKKHGFEVVVASGENDPRRQDDQVKDFLVKKVSAIVLTPCDSKAVGATIKEANQKGVPVFTADIAALSADAQVVCHIATDNYSGGREAAKAMIKALNNKGKVAIIDHPLVESCMLRMKGFRDELAAQKSAIEIVGSWPGKGAKDESFKAAQDILTSQKDLAGIFCINDPTALGAHAALEKTGLVGKILLVGFDGQLEGKQAIKDGKIFADPIQFPDQIGRVTAQTIIDYLDGKQVPKEKLIPTKLYFKEDAMKDPALK